VNVNESIQVSFNIIFFQTKKTYEQRCRENDACKKELENKATYTPKEEERVRAWFTLCNDFLYLCRRV